MVILHFDLQPQFKYRNYFVYTSHHFTPHGRYELNKLASLPMCGFIAQLVEHRTGISRRSRVQIPLKPWFFQASSFQLLKLENLLRWSFFTLIYNRSSNIWIISYILHINRILVYLCVFVIELPFYLARTGTDLFLAGTEFWRKLLVRKGSIVMYFDNTNLELTC